jgi:catechol 2,3-dioxygenase-like lactoylglutathione lyase family enzyme
MPVTELNHYLLVARNLEKTKKFYQTVLGLKLASERPDFGFPGYWLKAGGNICVHLASQAPNRIRDRGVRAACGERGRG